MTVLLEYTATFLAHAASLAGWTLLLLGLLVVAWASWQLAGFRGRHAMNGEGYWGYLVYIHFAVPGGMLMAFALVLIGIGRVL